MFLFYVYYITECSYNVLAKLSETIGVIKRKKEIYINTCPKTLPLRITITFFSITKNKLPNK